MKQNIRALGGRGYTLARRGRRRRRQRLAVAADKQKAAGHGQHHGCVAENGSIETSPRRGGGVRRNFGVVGHGQTSWQDGEGSTQYGVLSTAYAGGTGRAVTETAVSNCSLPPASCILGQFL